MSSYAIGLDYGTNSVRAILVRCADGAEVAAAVMEYPHGQAGIILSPEDPNLARQHPADYVLGAETTIKQVLAEAAASVDGFDAAEVVGIGVDTTGSTPLPVDQAGRPLAFEDRFAKNPNAMAWLWKDHTSIAEAEEITALAAEIRPDYLLKCGGTYSSEWFFAKLLHCIRVDAEVFDAAASWVEIADWIPAFLTGAQKPAHLTACVCAAGHKAMYSDQWGGYPDAEFLGKLDPRLAELREVLQDKAHAIDHVAGTLTEQWALRTGLRPGIAVATGAFDAHLGAVGAGIGPGTMVKVLGTSGCDMVVAPGDEPVADIPGLCGIVKGSILPGFWGLEAGQSAVGDLYNWWVNVIQPGGGLSHEQLTTEAQKLSPGQSGLLALDWNHGNRTILVDQRLTGLMIGQTLSTTPGEVYRALIEATAFGALAIIERFEQYDVAIEQVVNCGGIAERNPMVMQIYADVTGRPMKISRSAQTCALGAAIAGAVAAGSEAGGHDSFADAQAAMTGLKEAVYTPHAGAHETYRKLYRLWMQLHDSFGGVSDSADLSKVMKDLLAIRAEARSQG
ncbi:MAG: ribulokinase [Phycisphaerae bacterium]